MNEALETITYKGYDIEIYQDENAENPRKAWDNFGTMLCVHRRYELGDEALRDADGLWDALAREAGLDWDTLTEPDIAREDAIEKVLSAIEKQGGVILPLYLYEHSGITMNTSGFSCEWDSGQVGYIYATGAMIRKEYGVKRITKQVREKVEKLLKAEVATYDEYLTGSVYYYTINHGDIGSCGGFYGYDQEESGLLENARGDIDAYIKNQRQAHFAKRKVQIQNHVPLEKREPLTV